MRIYKNTIIIEINILYIIILCINIINCTNKKWSDPIIIENDTLYHHWDKRMVIGEKDSLYFVGLESVKTPTKQIGLKQIIFGANIEGIITNEKISNINYSAINPSIIKDHRGDLHCIWCEWVGKNEEKPLPKANKILYSFRKNSQWTDPIEILQIDTIEKNHKKDLNLWTKIDNNDTIHIIWKYFDTSGRSVVEHVKGRENNWSNKNLLDFKFAYLDFCFDKSNVMHLALIHPVFKSGSKDVNSVFYSKSFDNGYKWDNETLIDKSGIFGAYEIEILSDQMNTIHLFWGKDLTGDMNSECLRYSFSSDQKNWSTPENIGESLNGYIGKPSISINSQNKIFVMLDWSPEFINRTHRIYLATRERTKWIYPKLMFENARFPRLCIDNKDYLHMIMMYKEDKSGSKYRWVYVKNKKSL
jgi:hypothetical protein